MKQEILLGKGTLVDSRRVREPRTTALPCNLQSWESSIPISIFMEMGIVSELPVANRSDSGSFLVVHASLSQGGSCESSGRLVRHIDCHLLSPFDLSEVLPSWW